jgi:hypothetical protein
MVMRPLCRKGAVCVDGYAADCCLWLQVPPDRWQSSSGAYCIACRTAVWVTLGTQGRVYVHIGLAAAAAARQALHILHCFEDCCEGELCH